MAPVSFTNGEFAMFSLCKKMMEVIPQGQELEDAAAPMLALFVSVLVI